MKKTNQKSLPKLASHDKGRARIGADMKALKSSNKEIRPLMRCLARAVDTVPSFLRPHGTASAPEYAEQKFLTHIRAVLSNLEAD
jgi:hypothetical protein